MHRLWIAPVLLLALYAALAIGSLARDSPTIDEVGHLAAGYSYLATGDFRLNREHPPLIKLLAAAPLVFLGLDPVPNTPGWNTADTDVFKRDFLLRNRVPPERLIFLGRLLPVVLGILMGAALFAWARELWGHGPGVFVLFLYALCPNILAHTRLVTMDGGLACFTLMAVFSLWRFAHAPTFTWAVLCGVSLGSALLAKYTGTVTAATSGLLYAVVVWSNRRSAGAEPPSRQFIWRAALIPILAGVLIAVVFGFPNGLFNYYDGMRRAARLIDPEHRGRWAFLWGEYSKDGFWHYHLLAQLWKTPLPTLLLFGGSLCIAAKDVSGRLRWCFILLPIAAFHVAGMFSPVNVGLRYVLPVFPFVLLACGSVARWVETRRPAYRAAIAALCVWQLVGTLRTYPHFIPYFNEVAGGPASGIHYLDDSNIDWGQAMYDLRDYIDRTRPETVRLAVFEAVPTEAYGIRFEPIRLRDLVWPEEGVTYFVSADLLQRRSFFGDNTAVRFHWLERYRPVDSIAGSIFVYRFTTDATASIETGAFYVPRDKWYRDAVTILEAILAQSPQFDEARRLLVDIAADRAGREGLTPR